ncbi:hypothetical protein Rhopal_003347-T1 [Rhodotorula paludigena]|uniref:Uncharacterized protein n=1 Tax=Rhodotorula paludigena TaxID=86838 RepID=A0AAV5GNR9_9BASI|nr:hypothetical protein Rhopal_003347-T1 [Rhodotorula paludigena]
MSRAGGAGSSPVAAIERGPIAGEFHDDFYPGPHEYAVKLHTDEASLEMLIEQIRTDNPFVDEDYFTGRQSDRAKKEARKHALELAKRLLLGLTALFEVLMHKQLLAPYRKWHVQFRTFVYGSVPWYERLWVRVVALTTETIRVERPSLPPAAAAAGPAKPAKSSKKMGLFRRSSRAGETSSAAAQPSLPALPTLPDTLVQTAVREGAKGHALEIAEDDTQKHRGQPALRDRFVRRPDHDSGVSGARAWSWGWMCEREMDRTPRAHFAEVLEPVFATDVTLSCVGIRLTFEPSAFHVVGRSTS